MNMLSLTWWRNVYAKGGRLFAVGCAMVFIIPIVIGVGSNLYGRNAGPVQKEQSGTVFTINGSPVSTQEYNSYHPERAGGPPGREYAEAQGQILDRILAQRILAEIAKKHNIHPSDADIDRAVTQQRADLVKSGRVKSDSDADWDAFLNEISLTADEFRDQVATQSVLPQAVIDYYKNQEKVTSQDAKNQSSMVQMIPIMIQAQGPPSPFSPPNPKALPDAEAKKKAEDLLAKVKASADPNNAVILAIAKADSADYQPKSKTPGISEWTNEYTGTPYGAEFEKTLQKTPVGQFTDVAKTSGFRPGYIFAKVVARKDDLPKDYDEKKVIADLKNAQAMKKLGEEIQARVKSAKVVFPANQADKKAYYDSAKLKEMQGEMMNAMMGQSTKDTPTQADMDAQQKLIEADFEAMLKQMPDNPTACLIVAPALEAQMSSAPPAEQNKIRDRVISLYETALKSEGGTQFADTSMTLASLYRDKHDYKDANKQYKQVDKMLNQAPAWDLNSAQTEQSQRQKLLSGFQSIVSPELPDVAKSIADQQARLDTLKTKLVEYQIQAAADRKKQEEEQKQQQLEALKLKAEQEKLKVEQEKKNATPAPSPGAPKSGAGAPTPTPGAPKSGAGAPTPTPGAPKSGAGAPTPTPGAPKSGAGAPTPTPGAPKSGAGAPTPTPGAPKSGAGAPTPTPGAPKSGAGAPTPGTPSPGMPPSGTSSPGTGATSPTGGH